MTTRVLRVEHPVSRCGPYRIRGAWHSAPDWSDWLDMEYNPRRPAPREDGIDLDDLHEVWGAEPQAPFFYSEVVFGFATEEQYLAWFGGEEDALAEAGYVLAVYEVPVEYTVRTDCQAVFLRERATLIEEQPIHIAA